MELVTVPLELVKEAAVEVTKEAVKTAETAGEFGKVGKVIETEQVSFGRLGAGDCGRQISFGSLASGQFKNNENYLRWKDGIDVGEVNKGWIEELTNEIAAIYGNDTIKISKQYGLNNAGINTYLGRLVYDPNYLREAGNDYGMDSILGTLSHEVGHRVVHNIGLESEITPYENEACGRKQALRFMRLARRSIPFSVVLHQSVFLSCTLDNTVEI